MNSPTIDRCAAAIAEVWNGNCGYDLFSDEVKRPYREAARACLAALLPVSDGVKDIGYYIACENPRIEFEAQFTAAITAVLRGDA